MNKDRVETFMSLLLGVHLGLVVAIIAIPEPNLNIYLQFANYIYQEILNE